MVNGFLGAIAEAAGPHNKSITVLEGWSCIIDEGFVPSAGRIERPTGEAFRPEEGSKEGAVAPLDANGDDGPAARAGPKDAQGRVAML